MPDEQARRRFRREARTAARIRHPNVCHIYEIGEHGDELFIAMELLEGESLAARIARGPLPVADAIGISVEILSALGALHAAGVIHRDLKPSNVFLTPHGVKILDFGLARAQDAMVRLLRRTRSGSREPELYAALVQACRFCGLLEASVAAHERAQQLDRNVLTSADHTLWHLREYDRALEYLARRHYGETSIANRAVQALLLGELGQKDEALRRYREIEQARLTDYIRDMVCVYRALLEDRRDECLQAWERLLARVIDAETIWQVARAFAFFGERDRALATFNLSLERGFIIYRILTRVDPWLDVLRPDPGFVDLVRRSESLYRAAQAAFTEAGGEQLFVAVPVPATRTRF